MLGLKIIEPTAPTRSNAILDFIIIGSNIRAKEISIMNSPSDHKALLWEINVEMLKRRKLLKYPSRETAEEISLNLINNREIPDAHTFIRELEVLRRKKKKSMWKIIKQRTRKDDGLMRKLLAITDPKEVSKTINEHWSHFWRDTEEMRYSKESAKAYQRLKKILKYHLFEKRDGGIINSLKLDDGTFEDRPEQVNEQLLKTMEEIQVDNRWEWLRETDFPKLKRMNEGSTLMIID